MQSIATVRRSWALAALFALISSAFAIAGPDRARADTFTTGTAAPVVTIMAYPDEGIQPYYQNTTAAPDGAVAYAVEVEVLDTDGVDTIESVEICFYNGDSSLAACTNPAAPNYLNAKTNFHMDWLSDEAEIT